MIAYQEIFWVIRRRGEIPQPTTQEPGKTKDQCYSIHDVNINAKVGQGMQIEFHAGEAFFRKPESRPRQNYLATLPDFPL
jgi:hypothetical protein